MLLIDGLAYWNVGKTFPPNVMEDANLISLYRNEPLLKDATQHLQLRLIQMVLDS